MFQLQVVIVLNIIALFSQIVYSLNVCQQSQEKEQFIF